MKSFAFVMVLAFLLNFSIYADAQQYECRAGKLTYYSSIPCGNIPDVPKSYLNEPDGFRGIKWGTDITGLKEMFGIATDPSYGGIEVYEKQGETLQIGSARLNRIEYRSWQRKLAIVAIYVSGYVNWQGLKNTTTERFGKGYRPNRFMERYFWFGDMTQMTLEYNEVSKVGSLFMFSKILQEQMEAYNRQKAKEGAEKGF